MCVGLHLRSEISLIEMHAKQNPAKSWCELFLFNGNPDKKIFCNKKTHNFIQFHIYSSPPKKNVRNESYGRKIIFLPISIRRALAGRGEDRKKSIMENSGWNKSMKFKENDLANICSNFSRHSYTHINTKTREISVTELKEAAKKKHEPNSRKK